MSRENFDAVSRSLDLRERIVRQPLGEAHIGHKANVDLHPAIFEAQPAICLHELCAILAEQEVPTSRSGL